MRQVALALVIVGAVVWGVIGLFGLNLVEAIFGENLFSRIIYILVGLAGLYSLTLFGRVKD